MATLYVKEYHVVFPLAGWKQTIEVQIPDGSKVLTAQRDQDRLIIYALSDPEKPLGTRNFLILANDLGYYSGNDSLSYINTFPRYRSEIIFHMLEILNRDITQ
jgi:hypothetical protein